MNIPFQKHPGGTGWRAFFPTKSGEFNLSVIAGSCFYSTPRVDEKDPKNYTEIELAVFKGKEWASTNDLKDIFDILGDRGEHENTGDSPSNNVWRWVPIEKIVEIWEKC